ncbi:unnamed protein product [Paramecium pentaurelia]|uniref:VWFA domain-containing protein n=1 Tax=Paramecium pentaurelia TaxID=43138 RepID=A0A8S1WSV4_9CILI|nr:unnamed protein product [Paramecium pentaurelia]
MHMNQNTKNLKHTQPKVFTNQRSHININNNAIQNFEAKQQQSIKELLLNQMETKLLPKHFRSEPLNMGEIPQKNQQFIQNKNNQQLPQLIHNIKKKNNQLASQLQSIEQFDISSQTPQPLHLNIVPSFKPNQHFELFNINQHNQNDNLLKLISNNSSSKRNLNNQNLNNLPSIFQNRKIFGEKYNSKIIFDDDEYIVPIKTQNNRKLPSLDFSQIIQFEVKSLYNMSKLYKTKDQYLPGIVSIQTKEMETQQHAKRIGVDLICLIDRSASMMDQKIDMVKKTLIILLDLLESQDRLQLIIFNEEAERLTPLICATEKNKRYFKKMITTIYAKGGTLISSATNLAFQQLNQRRYKNNVNSIFLLSDGQDEEAVMEIQNQLKTIEEIFTLHTFGFGNDHDAEMMTQICNLKNGSFYFVQEISLLDEFFADALGGLISVIAQQIEISILCKNDKPFQDIEISKTYGQMWQHSGKYLKKIQLQQLSLGSRKDFVFELKLPKFSKKIEDNQRNVKIIEAQLKLKDPNTGENFTKTANLYLTFFNSDEQINQNEEDIEVLTQFYRVKGTEAIEQARKACENNNFEQARNIIDYFLIQIQKNNKKVTSKCGQIIQDLEQAKQASQQYQYHQYGLKQMYQLISNNYQQTGINSQFSMHGKQVQSLQPSYSNQMQQNLVSLVQSKKYPQSCQY